MKTMNIFKYFAFVAAAVMFAACEDELENQGDIDVIPNFPELVEDYAVEPGSTQEIVFTPNLDWKVSIPSEIRQWFWIKDGSFTAVELTGKASSDPISVFIGVTENASFDKNYTCDVTLEMGDTSKVIAKYMLPAKNKTLQVYAAVASEDGFKIDADNVSYVYSTETAAKLELMWSKADAEFRLPIKVASNCEWTVELPEWAEMNVPEATTGVVDLVLKGESIEAATGKLVFKSGDTVLLELDAAVPSCSGIDVYSAKMSDGEYEYVDGGYAWNEKPVEDVALVWLGSDFRVPVLVDSKCNWTVELPEWLAVELPEKTAGQVSLTLKGVPAKYPLEETSGKIVFKMGKETLKTLNVTIPGCKDIMSFNLDMNLTQMEFNHVGAFKTSTGFVEGHVSGTIIGSKAVRVVAVETTGGKVGAENPDWLTIELAAWNTAADANVLQERSISFSVKENTGLARTAYVFVLPPSVTAQVTEMLDEDAYVKDDYVKYATYVVQGSQNYEDYISTGVAESFSLSHIEDEALIEILDQKFGSSAHRYSLVYNDIYASDDAWMTLSVPYADVKVYDADMTTEKTGDDSFWLSFNANEDSNNTAGVVMMDFEDQKLPPVPLVGYIVFVDGSSNVLAIVECKSPVGDYISMNVEGELPYVFAEMSKAKAERLVADLGQTNNVYRLTYTDKSANEKAVMNLSLAYDHYKVFDKTMEDMTSDASWWLGIEKSGEDGMTAIVQMFKGGELSEDPTIGYIVLYGSDSSVYAIIECISCSGEIDVSEERFVDPSAAEAAGASVYEVVAGDIYDNYKEYTCPILKLVYTDRNTALSLKTPNTLYQFTVNPYSKQNAISIDGKDMYNDAGYLWDWSESENKYITQWYEEIKGSNGKKEKHYYYKDNIEIKMHFDVSDNCLVILRSSNSESHPELIIYCVLDLN